MSVLTDEILSIIPRFFDGGTGPSHDDLGRLFLRFGLDKADPAEPGVTIGKVKRLRAVLGYAIEARGPNGVRTCRIPCGAKQRRIRTAKLGSRDKRDQPPAIGPELAVSGPDSTVPPSQDPANAR